MEKMEHEICLDSDIIIDILKGKQRAQEALERNERYFCTTAVNAFEVYAGEKDQAVADGLFSQLPVINLTQKSARVAGAIFRDLKKKGQLIDIRDLFVASICIINSFELLTFNKKHFERMQEYGLILAQPK